MLVKLVSIPSPMRNEAHRAGNRMEVREQKRNYPFFKALHRIFKQAKFAMYTPVPLYSATSPKDPESVQIPKQHAETTQASPPSMYQCMCWWVTVHSNTCQEKMMGEANYKMIAKGDP